ncbi:hypothetical protein D3C85_1321930 [compost metagenome]
MDAEVMDRLQAHIETLNIQELREATAEAIDVDYFSFLYEVEDDNDPYNEGWF